MLRMWVALQSRFGDEGGASFIEYAFLVSLIAVVAVIAVTTFGEQVSSSLDETASQL